MYVHTKTFLQPSIFLQMIFMVVPLEQGVHNPQIMTRCPKGVENRYWVRTYSYNDISRLLLSSFRLHATARPHVQTSVFFVNKNVTFEKSQGKPFNRNAEILVVGRLPEKPKNRPKIPKPEPNRNRKLQIFQKPNRTETEFKNRG